MQSRGPVVLLDADDFLFDLRTPMREIFRFGHKVMFEEGWDFAGSNLALEWWWKAEIAKRPGFVLSLPLLPGVVYRLKECRAKVKELGGTLKVVTNPCYEISFWVKERFEALQSLGFAREDVHFTADKAGVDGDLLFDDGPHNCLSFVTYERALRHRQAGFFVHPWTEKVAMDLRVHPSIDVVRNWTDIVKLIGLYAEWMNEAPEATSGR